MIKFVHTNIIARDWKKLAQFYIDVFECEPLKPERDLDGEWIDKMTGILLKFKTGEINKPMYKKFYN
jgi:predicted enzyme related to lactoylglutathione lyase